MPEENQQNPAEREELEHYREIVENSPHMACVYSPNFKIEYMNRAYRTNFSVTGEEALGKSVLPLIPEEDREFFCATLNKLTPEQPEITYEYPVTGPNGEKQWQLWTIWANFAENGTLLRYHSIGKDITILKNTENALITRDRNYRLLFEQSPLGIYIARKDGTILEANDALLKLLGSPSREATKRINVLTFPQLVACGYPDAFQRVMETGETESIELRYISKWGKETTIFSYIIPLTDPEGNVCSIYTLMEDVTDKREAEEAFRKTAEEKHVLFTELQHRVKNSFMLIQGMVELMQDQDHSEETRNVLEEVSSRITAVSKMYDLLYETGSITEVDFGEYLSHLGDSLIGIASGIHLKKELNKVILPVKRAITCGIITAELLTNTLKHAFPENRSGEVLLQLKQDGSEARITVQDNGSGINDNLHKNDSQGLMLIRGLTKQIRGTLTINDDNGTRCLLTLPLE